MVATGKFGILIAGWCVFLSVSAGWDEETLGSDQVRLIRTLLSAERARRAYRSLGQTISMGDLPESRVRSMSDTGHHLDAQERSMGDWGDLLEAQKRDMGDRGDLLDAQERDMGDRGDLLGAQEGGMGDTAYLEARVRSMVDSIGRRDLLEARIRSLAASLGRATREQSLGQSVSTADLPGEARGQSDSTGNLPGDRGRRIVDCRLGNESCGGFIPCCGSLQCYWAEGVSLTKDGTCVECIAANQTCQRSKSCCTGMICDKEHLFQMDGVCREKRASGPCYKDKQCQSECKREDFWNFSGVCV